MSQQFRRAGWLAVLAVLAGCAETPPVAVAKIPSECEGAVYADPAVREEIMKGAGSDYYRNTHQAELAYAKQGATARCLRQKGLAPMGGGVERPRLPG